MMPLHPLIVTLERAETRTAIATLKAKFNLTKLAPLSLLFPKTTDATTEIIWSVRGDLTDDARTALESALNTILALPNLGTLVHIFLNTPGQEVQFMIDRNLADYISSHGGEISVYEVNETTGVVILTLHGACSGCPSSLGTLKFGIEKILKQYLPWVKDVQSSELPVEPDFDFVL